MTPYIFDDRSSPEDVGDAIKYWYNKGPEERDRCGRLGHDFLNSDSAGLSDVEMCSRFVDSIDTTFEKWKPKKKYTLEAV